MEELLKIRGGHRLTGEVSVSGGKNAAVAIIPAALLASSPSVIENLPDISDIRVLIDMLKWLGAGVEYDGSTMTVDPRTMTRNDPPGELAGRMRASYYLLPVLVSAFGSAKVAMPGGCAIGARPIDQTIHGLRSLGIAVDDTRGEVIYAERTDNAHGAEIFLDMPSVGATINTMLMAVSVPGSTTIHNAAKEPHIVDTANFLNSMGAAVRGAGTDVIRISGGRPLHGTNYTVIPDQIETGTLMIAAAATGGDVVIRGAIPTHMEALSAKLLEIGVHIYTEDDLIRVKCVSPLRAVSVKTQVYPGFPTDLQQPITSLLTVANGTSVVTENIFDNRLIFTRELIKMGARINVYGNTATIEGVKKLTGAHVTATDLRAGAAMVIAALMAEGDTYISNVQYILRGYEGIDRKLIGLGAEIEHIEKKP